MSTISKAIQRFETSIVNLNKSIKRTEQAIIDSHDKIKYLELIGKEFPEAKYFATQDKIVVDNKEANKFKLNKSPGPYGSKIDIDVYFYHNRRKIYCSKRAFRVATYDKRGLCFNCFEINKIRRYDKVYNLVLAKLSKLTIDYRKEYSSLITFASSTPVSKESEKYITEKINRYLILQ